ncbi:MAG: methylmalonyl Co-A mutase-associated GTPase MeaB [Chloroflexota bacterium]|nr:MAG: methylmalonyl Co-A mutase-associated GTPase MeaB [Chloroflexota bacterium]
MNLAASVLTGDRLAISRLLSQVENDTPEGRLALSELFAHTGRAHLIGVTGAPGTGKSSLVNQLARYYRHPKAGENPRRVAIVAVDPSSPFSGGAILGDRIRMRDLAGDSGVFIRSMASRGSLGGLASATASVVQVFDAAGFEVIMVETVGAGQAEVDIARLAHTTLVVEAPGLGDEIQAIKAGILEIADVLVVNKADQPGVENTERALRSMLDLAHPTPRIFRHHGKAEAIPDPAGSPAQPLWITPIQRTVSTEGTGIPEVAEHIARHRAYLQTTGDWQRREHARIQNELETLLRETLVARWRQSTGDDAYQQVLDSLYDRKISPHQAVEKLLASE